MDRADESPEREEVDVDDTRFILQREFMALVSVAVVMSLAAFWHHYTGGGPGSASLLIVCPILISLFMDYEGYHYHCFSFKAIAIKASVQVALCSQFLGLKAEGNVKVSHHFNSLDQLLLFLLFNSLGLAGMFRLVLTMIYCLVRIVVTHCREMIPGFEETPWAQRREFEIYTDVVWRETFAICLTAVVAGMIPGGHSHDAPILSQLNMFYLAGLSLVNVMIDCYQFPTWFTFKYLTARITVQVMHFHMMRYGILPFATTDKSEWIVNLLAHAALSRLIMSPIWTGFRVHLGPFRGDRGDRR